MNLFLIEIFDLHHALYEESPRVSIMKSAKDKGKYDLMAMKLEMSNICSLHKMKHTISSYIKKIQFPTQNMLESTRHLFRNILKMYCPLKMGFNGFFYNDNKEYILGDLFIHLCH